MLKDQRTGIRTDYGSPAQRGVVGSAATAGQAGRPRGTGSSDGIKVKGKRATARQRSVIDGALAEADQLNASRRVMVALVMALTQESRCGEESSNLLQQSTAWNNATDAKSPAKATRAFLVTGPTSWKKVHGGLKSAPGNLANAVQAVQKSGAGAGAYARWQNEASSTVDTWSARGGGSDSQRRKRYEFARGERHGQKENSWDCMARLVEEVAAYRWAAGNTLYAVSGDELRAGAPSLTIRGDEGWLIKPPAFSWANNRSVSEISIDVLTEHWNVMPGATVVMGSQFGALAGRFMVWHVSGESLDSPVVTVTLRRPTRLKDEPAAELTSTSNGAGGKLHDVAQQISSHRGDYLLGGGHGVPLNKLKSSDRMDCSSSVSLALFRAGFFDGSTALVSGDFARSYGKAGKGQEFTVWANASHVWLEGYDTDGSFAWRFDTSHHGGQSGPMLTTAKRTDQSRFTARHWPNH